MSRTSSRTRRSSRSWAARSRRAFFWSVRPAPGRRFSPRPSPAKRTFHSFRSRGRISSRCSWASAPRACAICSSRARSTRRASSSWMRSTRSVATAAPASAAAMANLVNEAALLDARKNKQVVGIVDFENAKDKVLMGVERRSMIISDGEKRTIAYHEAGHTLVADFLPGTDPVHKVTITPRGRALGLTQQLPLDDKYNYSKDYLLNRITILLGGRAAEEIVLKQQTKGAGG